MDGRKATGLIGPTIVAVLASLLPIVTTTASPVVPEPWFYELPVLAADGIQHVVSVFAHPVTSAVYAGGHTDVHLQGATFRHLNGVTPDQLQGPNGFVLKYSPSGFLSAGPLEIGTDGSDHVHAVTADETAVYVVGHTDDTTATEECREPDGICDDIFVSKLSHDLRQHEWTVRFGSNRYDVPEGIAVDSQGVYVVGFMDATLDVAKSANPNTDSGTAFVRKIAKSGDLLWHQQIATTGFNSANAVAVDSTGVYVAGQVSGATAGGERHFDAFVSKRDLQDGTPMWTPELRLLANGLPGIDIANGISVNASGVYAAGRVDGAVSGFINSGSSDAFVAKLRPTDGVYRWTTQFGTSKFDEAFGVAAHASGVFVSGQACGDPSVLTYEVEGTPIPECIATPAAIVDPEPHTGEAFVVRFDFAGAHVSTKVLNEISTTKFNEHALAITLDAGGRVYVAGFSNSPDTGHGNLATCDGFVLGMDLVPTFTAVQDGAWTDPDTWGGAVPRPSDNKVIPSGVRIIENDADIPNSGLISNSGTIQLAGSQGELFNNSGSIHNLGAITVINTAGFGIHSAGIIHNQRVGLPVFPPTEPFSRVGTISFGNLGGTALNNAGTLMNDGFINLMTRGEGVGFTNAGVVRTDGRILVSNGESSDFGMWNLGTIDNTRNITIRNSAGTGIINNAGINNAVTGTIRVANTGGTGLRNDTVHFAPGRIRNDGAVEIECEATYTGSPPVGNPITDVCDRTPPQIAISSVTAPEEGFALSQTITTFPATVGTSPISVTGTASDNFKVQSIVVKGVPASVVGDSWTATGVGLDPGSNSITATAADSSGNTMTIHVEVTLNRDVDADGIENSVDGDCSGASQRSEATTASRRFCDKPEPFNGKLSARIVSVDPDVSIRVADAAPNPDEGVILTVSGPADRGARVNIDGSSGTFEYFAGTHVISDPDLTTFVEVIEGLAQGEFIVNGATVSVVIEAGEKVKVVERIIDGELRLAVTSLRGTVTVNGFPLSSSDSLSVPFPVTIDIKPGSYPNTIKVGSGGTVPVAILSTEGFDARAIDPGSVTLASAPVRLKGRGTPMAAAEDVNGDGRLDLVVHVSTEALEISETDTEAVLQGRTFTGTAMSAMPVRSVDSIRVVSE